MMRYLKALSLTSHVNNWSVNKYQPKILHVFDHACNLINENKEVLSIVTQEIGNGPFNLIVEDDVLFSEYLNIESPISILEKYLQIGDLTVDLENAKLWNPKPDWKELHCNKEFITKQISELPISNYSSPISQLSNSLVSDLSFSLVTADVSRAKSLAAKFAGLGIGLTPSGDDFIMGALYAIWIIHPAEVAGVLAKVIAETASPLTTSLSAAWIRSAGRGEAGIMWHELFDALIAKDDLELPIARILSIGETSGADAFHGFIGVMSAFKEQIPVDVI